MGAKTCMLVHASGDARVALSAARAVDAEATRQFVARLFPGATADPAGGTTLMGVRAFGDEIHAASFPGVSVVVAKDFGIDHPSKLPAQLLPVIPGTVYLHAMHSVVDWFAFAVWQDGRLVRSLSVSPDSGVMEDIGERLPFELPFWAGEQPAIDEEELEEGENGYPVPFHPLELGEAALFEFFGYQLEGVKELYSPASVPLLAFRRAKPWWRFW